MADKNFQVKNGLTVGTTERISSAGVFTGSLASTNTATTQSASNNSTKIATTAYVDTAVTNLVDSAPGTLNTLNELAAALGDDANYSTTITSSLATKAAIAGQAFTGTISVTGGYLHSNTVGSNKKFEWSRTGGKDFSLEHDADGFYFYNETDSDLLVRFANGGNVGIGLNTPTSPLHVSGNGHITGLLGVNKSVNTAVGLSVGSDASSSTSYGLEVCNASSNTRFLVDGSGSQRFYGSDNSETARFTDGKLGIGNTSPGTNHAKANNLVVGSGGAGGMAVYSGTAEGWYAFSRANANNSDAYDGGISYNGDRDLKFHTNAGATRMTIDGSGDVGVGIATSIDGKFHIYQGSAGSLSASGDKNTLVLENSTHGGMSVLTPDAAEAGMFTGHPSASRCGEFHTRYDTKALRVGTRGHASFKWYMYAGNWTNTLIMNTDALYPATDSAFDLGTNSMRFANIFTGDLHLSNEGKEEGNEVDGTSGNWTIQEGEEHLYIKNNKSGKKYRFALEEIE